MMDLFVKLWKHIMPLLWPTQRVGSNKVQGERHFEDCMKFFFHIIITTKLETWDKPSSSVGINAGWKSWWVTSSRWDRLVAELLGSCAKPLTPSTSSVISSSVWNTSLTTLVCSTDAADASNKHEHRLVTCTVRVPFRHTSPYCSLKWQLQKFTLLTF